MKKFMKEVREEVACMEEKLKKVFPRMEKMSDRGAKGTSLLVIILLGIAAIVAVLTVVILINEVAINLGFYDLVGGAIFWGGVIIVITVVMSNEVEKFGVLTTAIKTIMFIAILKVLGEATGSDTSVVDMLLKWIAEAPQTIKNFLEE